MKAMLIGILAYWLLMIVGMWLFLHFIWPVIAAFITANGVKGL